jgi:hypothetical protein
VALKYQAGGIRLTVLKRRKTYSLENKDDWVAMPPRYMLTDLDSTVTQTQTRYEKRKRSKDSDGFWSSSVSYMFCVSIVGTQGQIISSPLAYAIMCFAAVVASIGIVELITLYRQLFELACIDTCE